MNRQQATDYVIRELGKHHQRNDIIQRLCETGELSWKEAEKFVQQVEEENTSKIALRQSPLVTVIGIGSALVGLALMAWVALETLQGAIIFLMGIPYLGNLSYFFTGLVMMVAGLWGMWETILRIWNS
ncbi:MAG TPA: hypothetical protein VFQ13_08535 [Anaerolineales bacterium]|nr:hypothetical protein [Anaerolineales bacterium]